jgi:hypothetical protein
MTTYDSVDARVEWLVAQQLARQGPVAMSG